MRLKRTLSKLLGPNIRSVIRGIKSISTRSPMNFSVLDYNKYWVSREKYFDMQPRFPIIADLVESGSTVLDVGCGDGALLSYLKKTKNVNELGIDISPVAIERARLHNVNARVIHLSELAVEASEQFDYVVMSEVIEHVPNSEEFVINGLKLAGKSLIVTFPNIAYWPHRLRLLVGRFPVQWVYHPAEHIRFWSVSDFRYWLAGLDIDATAEFFSSNGSTLWSLHKRLPNLFGNQIVVCIQSSSGYLLED